MINKFLLLLLLFLILSTNAKDAFAAKNITCGFGECTPDFNSSMYLEKESMTYIDVGQSNTDSVSVVLPVNQEPRSLFLSVNNNTSAGKNLSVDLQSKRPNYNTETFILVGDIFSNLSINTNGYGGISGKNASELCAERFLSGFYGELAKNQYLSFRSGESNNLPMNKCTADDVEYLQRTSFQCEEHTNDSSYQEENFALVNVSRVKYKQKCTGISNKYKCVKRKVRAVCQWESLPLGYPDPATGYPCTNNWGGNNCQYNVASSCWNQGNVPEEIRSTTFPLAGNPNPWELNFNSENCSYPNGVTPSPKLYSQAVGPKGGGVATNETTEMFENIYKTFERENRLEELCTSYSSGPSGAGWRFAGVSQMMYEEPGVDDDTLEPLPGSTWQIRETGYFETCSQYGDFEILTPIIEYHVNYGEIGNSCLDVSIPSDVNKKIPWNVAGEEQDRTFGLESVMCSPDNCTEETITRNLKATLDTIDPLSGTSGTAQGDSILFIYDALNTNLTSKAGLGGAGGNNDLPRQTEPKYCVKKMDASTQTINSEYALNPMIYFNIYEWTSLDIKAGKPNGSDAPFSTKGIKLFKKIDSSVRHLIKSESF